MIRAAALSPDQGWFIEHECSGAVFSKDLLGLDWKQAQCRDYVIDFLRGRLRYGSAGDWRPRLHDSTTAFMRRVIGYMPFFRSPLRCWRRQADSSEILLLGAVGLRGLPKILGWITEPGIAAWSWTKRLRIRLLLPYQRQPSGRTERQSCRAAFRMNQPPMAHLLCLDAEGSRRC